MHLLIIYFANRLSIQLENRCSSWKLCFLVKPAKLLSNEKRNFIKLLLREKENSHWSCSKSTAHPKNQLRKKKKKRQIDSTERNRKLTFYFY